MKTVLDNVRPSQQKQIVLVPARNNQLAVVYLVAARAGFRITQEAYQTIQAERTIERQSLVAIKSEAQKI